MRGKETSFVWPEALLFVQAFVVTVKTTLGNEQGECGGLDVLEKDRVDVGVLTDAQDLLAVVAADPADKIFDHHRCD